MERLNAWNTYDLPMHDECMEFANDYINFLNVGKTERECVDFFVAEAEKKRLHRTQPRDCGKQAAQGR